MTACETISTQAPRLTVDGPDPETFYQLLRRPDFVPGFEIHQRLGGGAFGEVYRATKRSISKSYAIKFLRLEDARERATLQRELDQVRLFAELDHPNLVPIEDMGIGLGVPYLVMGYAGEDTLARRLRGGRLSCREALALFRQVCLGVRALHAKRIAHLDLKPSNIFLRGKTARVGDYGLARLMEVGRCTLSFGRGTPHYMAPEILRNEADLRADLYSLGVILYECLAQRVPFEPTEGTGLVVRLDDLPPTFPTHFPAAYRASVERCLRLLPEDRFAGVDELMASVEGADCVRSPERAELAAPERAELAALERAELAALERAELAAIGERLPEALVIAGSRPRARNAQSLLAREVGEARRRRDSSNRAAFRTLAAVRARSGNRGAEVLAWPACTSAIQTARAWIQCNAKWIVAAAKFSGYVTIMATAAALLLLVIERLILSWGSGPA